MDRAAKVSAQDPQVIFTVFSPPHSAARVGSEKGLSQRDGARARVISSKKYTRTFLGIYPSVLT